MFSKQVGDFGDFEGFFRALERLKPKIRSLREGFGMHPPLSMCFSGGVDLDTTAGHFSDTFHRGTGPPKWSVHSSR